MICLLQALTANGSASGTDLLQNEQLNCELLHVAALYMYMSICEPGKKYIHMYNVCSHFICTTTACIELLHVHFSIGRLSIAHVHVDSNVHVHVHV